MKKSLSAILLIIACSVSSKSFAQYNVVKANIFSPAVYTGSLSFERVFNWGMSFDLGASYTPATDISNSYIDGRQEISGYSATIGLRKYTKMEAPDGFYFGPYLRHQSISFTENNIAATLNVSSAGVKSGYQFIIGEAFSIDIFYGSGVGMYDISASEVFGDITSLIGSGKVVSAAATYGFNLGFAF